MNFSEKLNYYIDYIGCTAKELSDISSISPSVISRYRSGDRYPKYNSKQLDNIINSLYILAKQNNINIKKDTIKKDLEETISTNDIDIELFRNNFNKLIKELNINVSELSRYIGFDASYISKIRSGTRKPQNINDFTNSISRYIINYHNDDKNKLLLSNLLNCNKEDLNDNDSFNIILINWLSNDNYEDNDMVNSFLKKLDNFDLNDYIKTIKFDKIKIPTLPKGIAKAKTYYGLEGFKKSQLDALKTIILSKSHDDIFFYSNMPMIEAGKDKEFTKKYMIALAMCLKKGLNLNMIHDLDRPFEELILGLEGWIPLYMTGQINSYYLNNNSNLHYSQIECSSNAVALSGTCPTGYINKAKIIVSNKNNDIKYYKDIHSLLLKKANNLINIYNEDKKDEYIEILNNNINIKGDRKNILFDLPLYTINDKLLNKILDKNNIDDKKRKLIKDIINNQKKRVNTILKNNNISDKITLLTKEEFNEEKHYLNLSNYFIKEILYTYDDYIEHYKQTLDYMKSNTNYKCIINKNNIFKNINIYIISNKQVIITKINKPIIHFVIYYPKLIDAIDKFT
ncbi:MAG: helix-turn-helix transcriptional regulator [Bacilli bacterium]|nr:helix-turn-helix transcriptional regulator [Bacilli bacterium]